jgi:hypothetical protein
MESQSGVLIRYLSPVSGGEVGALHRVRGRCLSSTEPPPARKARHLPRRRWGGVAEKTLTPALSHGAREREEESKHQTTASVQVVEAKCV